MLLLSRFRVVALVSPEQGGREGGERATLLPFSLYSSCWERKEALFCTGPARAGVAAGRAVGEEGEGSWKLQAAAHDNALLSVAIATQAPRTIFMYTRTQSLNRRKQLLTFHRRKTSCVPFLYVTAPPNHFFIRGLDSLLNDEEQCVMGFGTNLRLTSLISFA